MNAVKVHNKVPFASSMSCWLQVNGMELPRLEQSSHQYDSRYLAWESVRKERNPYFVNGTGFEGYFIGICRTPDAALEELLHLGHTMLDDITHLYPHNYSYRSLLMKTLRGENCNFDAVYKWNAIFGAMLGRLRAQTLHDRDAIAFRAETYRLIEKLPGISYQANHDTVEQDYYIAHDTSHLSQRLAVSNNILNGSDQEAWSVLKTVGKFGHPLVRNYLNREIQQHGYHTAA